MKRADGSWEPIDDYVLDFAVERMRSGEKVAIVTLVGVEGSSPRPLGAQMAVAETGQWVGYLSGGCIEHAVAAEAVAAIAAGRSRRVRYGRGSPYLDIILPCGSAIDLVFDVGISLDTLVDIDARLANRLPAAMTIPMTAAGDGQAASFSRLYLPRRRLMILGTGPVAVQLARVGQAGGFDVALHSPDDLTLEAGRASGVASRFLRMPNPSGIAADFTHRHRFRFPRPWPGGRTASGRPWNGGFLYRRAGQPRNAKAAAGDPEEPGIR